MSAPSRNPAILPALRDQAADWHVRLASDVASEQDWLDFEAWLSASADHRRAFEAVEGLWQELDQAAPFKAEVPAKPAGAARHKSRARLWLPMAAAAALALAIGLDLGVRTLEPRPQMFETARGERQNVQLADGSRLTLNGGARLTVRLGRRQRDVELVRGEAAFDVAKDPSRPFVVALGDRQVRVVGTEFDILRHERSIVVTVRRGVVEVRPAAGATGGSVSRLVAGRSLSHREGEGTDKVGATDPASAFAWTEGRLIFRNERLVDVAKVLNRYVETPLVVEGDAQEIPVTAVVLLGEEDVMIRQLRGFLPITVRREGGEMRLARR